jgi:hypothetical protein
MTQPEYVPITNAERVRAVQRLPTPQQWMPDRKGEVVPVSQPSGWELGDPGPDQGYALSLAARLLPSLNIPATEQAADVVAGSVAVAMRRAALVGRAPCVFDLEFAFRLFGYLGRSVPGDLASWRAEAFRGADHDYWVRRRLAAMVPLDTLKLAPLEVAESPVGWRKLLGVTD